MNQSQILRYATTEESIVWDYLTSRFGERISIKPVFFQGDASASQFIIYNPSILYYAISFEQWGFGIDNADAYVWFYDESDVTSFGLTNSVRAIKSDDTSVFQLNQLKTKHVIFSRFEYTAGGGGNEITKLVGFQIGI